MKNTADYKGLENSNQELAYIKSNYQILESMADWVRVIDQDGIVTYANRSMKDDLGQDIIGKSYYEIVCDSKAGNSCLSKRSVETGEIVQKEITINGNIYSVKSSPIKDGDGKIIAFVEVFRNVSRERLLENELINKNKKMRDDLEFSKRLQQKILPKKQQVENINLDFIYKPSQTLSGDIFDIYSIDKENIGVYVSDVVGNGVSAALMTMFIRQTMRLMKYDPRQPSLIIRELHKKFLRLELEDEYYFTIFFGIFNIKTNKFKFVNAGHNCIPIRYNLEKAIIETIENKGYPISSLFKEVLCREKEIQIYVGDKILFYTDGVTESRDYLGREFGLERLKNIIRADPPNILRTIEEEILNHSLGEIKDDFALLLLEILE